MLNIEYPKIHSLWKREGYYLEGEDKNKTKVKSLIMGDYSQGEFANINKWRVEEKIDGTNIRIFYKDGKIRFDGRTDDAQIPCHLFEYLQTTFSECNFHEIFHCEEGEPWPSVILFGEGYGRKIQKNGEKYNPRVGFILFDAHVNGWWLQRKDIEEIAEKFIVPVVPSLGMMTENEIIFLVKSEPNSRLSPEYGCFEGVVCKTDPMMLFRNGNPVVWKLKCKDLK